MGREIGRRGEDACERPQKEGQSQIHSSLLRAPAQPLFQDCCRPFAMSAKSRRKDFGRITLLLCPIGTMLRPFVR